MFHRENGGGSGGWTDVERELDRCRRYGRSFALVALSPGEAEPAGAGLPRQLRSLDVAWWENGRLLVLVPEAGRAEAEALLARLAADAPEIVTAADARVAVFPEDGLTGGALRACLAGGGLAAERHRSAVNLPALLQAAARLADRDRRHGAPGSNGNGSRNGKGEHGLGDLVPATEAYRAASDPAGDRLL